MQLTCGEPLGLSVSQVSERARLDQLPCFVRKPQSRHSASVARTQQGHVDARPVPSATGRRLRTFVLPRACRCLMGSGEQPRHEPDQCRQGSVIIVKKMAPAQETKKTRALMKPGRLEPTQLTFFPAIPQDRATAPTADQGTYSPGERKTRPRPASPTPRRTSLTTLSGSGSSPSGSRRRRRSSTA